MKLYRILPEDQALALADKLKSLEWSQGRARTKELTGTTKQNREILNHLALQKIGKLIVNHPAIALDHIPLQCHPPKFSRYGPGERYGPHTDAAWMANTRTDLSCTLWLSDNFKGGDLRIDGHNYRGRPGEALVYECGLVHEVTAVVDGDRICAVTWIQSRIRDREKRRLVSDFRKLLAKIEDQPALFLEGGRIHSALLRRWVEN